jgi:hypothetical protein
MFNSSKDPRWMFLLDDLLIHIAVVLFLSHPLNRSEPLDLGDQYHTEKDDTLSTQKATWFVFEDSWSFGRAIDILYAEGLKPLVQDNIESVQLRRDNLLQWS